MRRIAVLVTMFGFTLRGDSVELKSGERIDGAFKRADSTGVVIEVAGQAITVPLSKVLAIYFGAAKPAASIPAPSVSSLHGRKLWMRSGRCARFPRAESLTANTRVESLMPRWWLISISRLLNLMRRSRGCRYTWPVNRREYTPQFIARCSLTRTHLSCGTFGYPQARHQEQ